MKRGEIYYVARRNDSVGSEMYSGRPALIVSNDKNNEYCDTVCVVYLTTKPKKNIPTHVPVRCRGLDGRTVFSTILCEHVYTLDKTRLGDIFCVMDEDSMKKVDDALAISLGINNKIVVDGNKNYENLILKREADFYKERYNELLELLKSRVR